MVKMVVMLRKSIFLLSALALCQFTSAEEAKPAKAPEAKPEEKKPDEKKDEKKADAETSSVIHGTIKIGGVDHAYKATATMLPILQPDGKPSAQVFHISYVKEGVDGEGSPGDLLLQRWSWQQQRLAASGGLWPEAGEPTC